MLAPLKWFIGIIAIALFAVGCENVPDTSTAAENENSSVNSESSTNVASTNTATENFQKTTLIRGLEHPWSMAWLPDGAMLITERPGRLRIVRDGKLDPNPIGGLPEVFAVNQGGLMEISLHPDFAKNRFVYLTYSHGSNNANRTRLARATFDGKTLGDVRVIFEVSQPKSGGQHFGSRIIWLPDRTMLLAIGDGGNPPVRLEGDFIRKQAQNRNSHLGKVLRLNDDGSIPKDNPFAKTANASPAIWSYGHRNIQGLAYDPANNRVWSTEHGARGGDELNLVEAGKNYGWPVVTHSKEYTGGEISQERSRPGMEDPKVVWTPATAPSGLAFYNGVRSADAQRANRFKEWKGDLFAGGLVSRDVRHIDLDEKGNVVSQKSIDIGQRVRDVRQGPDGLLYILTDQADGELIRLEEK
ncbi:PQQ-dependent sugar dehydrogenase [Mastigocoleus sp. MO_188.B34]|uniref:PQQ-dependent sugar dehydrogenase n=1 Tax=Mastigocoleus sp. MO_188.B34 TaxID=3036635 RepID=UPI00261EE629|nr:PQQ-dependent sugar dehydrogenase [Mastigocoleus sp. MO_188.B34]MDJ0694240.1 PQQ-dependent sugar dehydrogenase [Mastigocoleus sp. MO_188.B34]